MKFASLLGAAIPVADSSHLSDVKQMISSGKMPLSQLNMLVRDFAEMASIAQDSDPAFLKQLVEEEPLVKRLLNATSKDIVELVKRGRLCSDSEWEIVNAYLANTSNSKQRDKLGQMLREYEHRASRSS